MLTKPVFQPHMSEASLNEAIFDHEHYFGTFFSDIKKAKREEGWVVVALQTDGDKVHHWNYYPGRDGLTLTHTSYKLSRLQKQQAMDGTFAAFGRLFAKNTDKE